MSYSRRELYAMGEPFGDCATERKVDGRYLCGLGGGGGGNPANTTQTVTQELPAWARPFAKEAIGKAAALTNSPYQTYGGERIAQFTPLQKQAFEQAGGQQVASQIGQATGLAGLVGGSSFRDQGTAQGFMSPYMQAVVDQQMSSAQRQADIAGERRKAEFIRAGGFGGARQAIENAEAAKALASQKAELQAKGLQTAFEQAQNQFNQEQTQRLNAAQALGTLGTAQFGQEMDIMARRADLGGQQRAATQDILSQQYQDFLNQQRSPYDQLAFLTSMIRGTPMGGTTAQYQTSAAPSTASQLIGLGTAAAGAYGAAQGKAEGGEVKGYAAGGIASLSQPEIAAAADSMSDQQLQRTRGLPSITKLAEMTLDAEAEQRARERQAAAAQQAMMAQQPQMTVAEEQLAAIDAMEDGIAGLDIDDEAFTAAGGGIVAFQGGGSTWWEEELERLQAQGVDISAERRAAEAKRQQELDAFNRAMRNDPAQAKLRAEQQPRKDLRKGLDDPRIGIAGLTPEMAKAEQVAAAAPSGAKGTGAAPGAAPAGIAGLLPKNLQSLQDKYRSEVEAAGKAGETIEADRLAAIKRDQAEMGEIGAEREKRLKAQEKALEGAEGKNLNMALIEAGLAIMAGNSANAFENIGKGAMVGTKAYTTGMERIQNRKDKLDEAVMALDELRYGEKKASKKELRDAEAAVNKAKQATATALAAVTGKEAETAVELYTKNLDRQATLAAASMRAATTGTSKAVKDAEAAFAKDPAALAIKKQLESPIVANNPTKKAEAEAKLQRIRADKYRQFGATLEGDAGNAGADSDPLGILG